MARITIIDGHPDPDRRHFDHALADAYAEGAETGHEVRRVDVGSLDFPLLRSPRSWLEDQPPPAIAAAQQTIGWANHLVFVYPLWLGDVPALFKGFLEQVARPGFAIGKMGKGFPEKLLAGRSARVIVTMGMPAAFYQLYFRAHSLKSLERNILGFADRADPTFHRRQCRQGRRLSAQMAAARPRTRRGRGLNGHRRWPAATAP